MTTVSQLRRQVQEVEDLSLPVFVSVDDVLYPIGSVAVEDDHVAVVAEGAESPDEDEQLGHLTAAYDAGFEAGLLEAQRETPADPPVEEPPATT
jgi:hypothetical protein